MLLFWPVVLGQTLLVTSAQNCPAAAAVDARVREILGLRTTDALEERATVERDGSSLRVRLRSRDERVLGDRVLRAEGSCDELAGVVAVVLATWLSDVHPEYVGSLPEPAPPAASPGAPAPVGESERTATRHFGVSAALGAGFSAWSPATLGALGISFMPERSGLGAAATATLMAPRSQELASGSVRFWRWPLTIGPAYRVPVGAAALDLHAGVALAWLHVEGRFVLPVLPETRNALVGGGFVSARISKAWGRFEPFVDMTGVVWRPTAAFVRRGGEDQTFADLPGLELYLAVGASWPAW